jgi:hypothetical protein
MWLSLLAAPPPFILHCVLASFAIYHNLPFCLETKVAIACHPWFLLLFYIMPLGFSLATDAFAVGCLCMQDCTYLSVSINLLDKRLSTVDAVVIDSSGTFLFWMQKLSVVGHIFVRLPSYYDFMVSVAAVVRTDFIVWSAIS